MNIHRVNPCKRWLDIPVLNGIAHFFEVAEPVTVEGIKGPVQQIFDQAEQALGKIDSSRSCVLSVTVYLTDFANLEALNEVWDSWFPVGCAPSRTCAKAWLADPQYLVKIAFVAAANL